MNSFFSTDSFLTAGLKRSRRTRTRKPVRSRSKTCPSSSLSGKALHIIPELSEDDEPECSSPVYSSGSESSCSSPSYSPLSLYTSSRSVGGSHTLGLKSKRGPIGVKVTDIRLPKPEEVQFGMLATSDVHNLLDEDELLFSSEPPRPAPHPPSSARSISSRSPSRNSSDSPPSSSDSFQLSFPGGVSLEFPHPPFPKSPASAPHRSVEFYSKRDGSSSPSSSVSSIRSDCTSSPGSNSTGLPTTPVSSDDEDSSSRRTLPRRISIKPLFINKSAANLRHAPEIANISASPHEHDVENGCDWFDDPDEANEWYSREFSEILTLCSPIPPSFPARPESLSLASPSPALKTKGRSRLSKPLPDLPLPSPMPSAQLDPAFPRRKRSIPPIPKRAPPPPPVITTPPPEPHSRPPPRVSVPADIGLFDIELDLSPATGDAQSSFISESSASIYSQEGDLEVELDLGDDIGLDVPMRLPLSLPTSPVDLELDISTGLEELARAMERDDVFPLSPAMPETPMGSMDASPVDASTSIEVPSEMQPEGERVLRSRWSSSTLSSVREQDLRSPGSASSKMLRFYFGSRKGRSKVSPSPMSPSFATMKRKVHARGLSTDSDFSIGGDRPLRRRGSRSSSSTASDSGESTGSAGLRRKPIPVEMFIKC